MAEERIPEHTLLTPGDYVAQVEFVSYASGINLRHLAENAFGEAITKLSADEPQAWLQIRLPGGELQVTVQEAIAPHKHRARMPFEVLDVQGAPGVNVDLISRYVLVAFLNYSEVVDTPEVFKTTAETPPVPVNGEPPPTTSGAKTVAVVGGCLLGLWLLSYLGRKESG